MGKESFLEKIVSKRWWYIHNGKKSGDKKDAFKYVRSNAVPVIDFVIINIEGWESVKIMRIEARVESDHQPIGLYIKRKIRKDFKKKAGVIGKRQNVWTQESKKKYMEETEKLLFEKKVPSELWEELKEKVKKARRTNRAKIRLVGERNWGKVWWDQESKKKKREVKKVYKG